MSSVLVLFVICAQQDFLEFPQCVKVRASSIFVVFLALSVVFYMCFEKACRGLTVRRSIFVFVRGECVLFIASLSFAKWLSLAGCGVNSIVCVFEGLRIRLFCLIQLHGSCKYECTCCFVVFMFL